MLNEITDEANDTTLHLFFLLLLNLVREDLHARLGKL